jgi:hypothetical protein
MDLEVKQIAMPFQAGAGSYRIKSDPTANAGVE